MKLKRLHLKTLTEQPTSTVFTRKDGAVWTVALPLLPIPAPTETETETVPLTEANSPTTGTASEDAAQPEPQADPFAAVLGQSVTLVSLAGLTDQAVLGTLKLYELESSDADEPGASTPKSAAKRPKGQLSEEELLNF